MDIWYKNLRNSGDSKKKYVFGHRYITFPDIYRTKNKD